MGPIEGEAVGGASAFASLAGKRDLRYARFVSAADKVYPDQFIGDITERRAVDLAVSVQRAVVFVVRTTKLAIAATALTAVITAADLSGLIARAPTWVSRAADWLSLGALAGSIAALASGYVAYQVSLRGRTKMLNEKLEATATERSVYLGSAQYQFGVGEDGFCVFTNRLSCRIDYHAIDHDAFLRDNALPAIPIDALSAMDLDGIIKNRTANADEATACARLRYDIDAWWTRRKADHAKKHKNREFEDLLIRIPFAVQKDWLHPRDVPSGRPGRFRSHVRKLKSETLRLPTGALEAPGDSNLSPREFMMALYVMSHRHKRRVG